jgi:AcrR family transcriptional regulator
MTTELGLRERKKLKTRKLISEIAIRLFKEKGVEATTVEEICEQAEVSVSTFFRYFRSKEEAAFPDQDARVETVKNVLEAPLPGEKPSKTIRRAVHALIEYDLEVKGDLQAHLQLQEQEPALAAQALRSQAQSIDLFTTLVADLLGVDEHKDLRPRLVVSAVYGAVNASWNTWLAEDGNDDLAAIVDQAFDVLDRGFAKAI